MDYFEELKSFIYKYENLGIKEIENGAILIGHVPHVAPSAYLHILFSPLNDEDISELEDELEMSIPIYYKQFFKKSNGLSLFNDSLSLDGLRRNNKRDMVNVWQPYSLSDINVHERPRDAKLSFFYIGGYSRDGSVLYIDKDTNKVYRCSKESSKPLNEWKNFEEMLLSEINRLFKLFDKDGKKINPKIPTTP